MQAAWKSNSGTVGGASRHARRKAGGEETELQECETRKQHAPTHACVSACDYKAGTHAVWQCMSRSALTYGADDVVQKLHTQFQVGGSSWQSTGEKPSLGESGVHLMNELLTHDPEKRLDAAGALQHHWFKEAPSPQNPEWMPIY
jgi:serine/threonine protein kinase